MTVTAALVTQATILRNAPVKPDLRIWLPVIASCCAATALLSSDLGSILLTVWALIMYALLGEARPIPLVATFYLLLFGLRFLILAAGNVPVLPYFGVTVILLLSAYPVYLLMLLAFVRLPMNEIMACLERLRVPSSALIVVMVTHRYIPTLIGEIRTIGTAWSLRTRSVKPLTTNSTSSPRHPGQKPPSSPPAGRRTWPSKTAFSTRTSPTRSASTTSKPGRTSSAPSLTSSTPGSPNITTTTPKHAHTSRTA